MQEAEKIQNVLKKIGRISSIQALPGDASSRRYYRVKMAGTPLIVMKMDSFAEKGDSFSEETPFLQVQKHLYKLGVPVPKVHHVQGKKGIILLEDLGDQTLLKILEGIYKKREQLVWFKRAIDLLLDTHVKATKTTVPIDAYTMYFDEDKLMWEVNFTLAHFYNGIFARVIPNKDLAIIKLSFKDICKTLASQDWVFTHRDYHSRNIMVKNQKLYMIDFQDARWGCAQYDLSSLLRDSYYQLEDEVVYTLVNYYISKYKKMTSKSLNSKEFVRVFDLMSIQRNFKAIGSFASFFNSRKDARYLKFVGNTFENIRRNLLKFPEYEELRALLFRYYYF